MDKDVRTTPELCHQIQGPTEIFADKNFGWSKLFMDPIKVQLP